jgi:hypothetical protein
MEPAGHGVKMDDMISRVISLIVELRLPTLRSGATKLKTASLTVVHKTCWSFYDHHQPHQS